MASTETPQQSGQPHLQKQDLATLDVTKLTPQSPEVISRQATINIGTIGHVAHGKSTVVKAISSVHTVRFKNELERNITIKLDSHEYDDEGMHSPVSSSTAVAEEEDGIMDSGLDCSHESSNNHQKSSFSMLPPNAGRLSLPNEISEIPVEKLCPVVKLVKITKKEIYELTKHKNSKNNLREYIRKIRTQKRHEAKKLQLKNRRRSFNDYEDKKNKENALQSFLEFNNISGGGGGSGLSRLFSSLENYTRSVVDIDRYSDTASNADSEISRKKRPRRKSMMPTKFDFNDYESRPKRQKTETVKIKQEIKTDIEYQVESIGNIQFFKNELVFLIKWENYPPSENTWEPLRNIRDCKALDDFLRYEFEGDEAEVQKFIDEIIAEEMPKYKDRPKYWILDEIKKLDLVAYECGKVVYKESKNYENFNIAFKRAFRHQVMINYFRELIISQEETHETIRTDFMEKELNMFDIKIENDVDFDTLKHFNYTRETIMPPDIVENKSILMGCQCTECSNDSSKCCPTLAHKKNNFGYKFVDKTKRLRLRQRQMIFECNDNCACDKNCLNRVTQQPRTYPMTIFKTNDGRGWGVKAAAKIPRGTYLMEYTGEIINQEESVRRGEKQDEQGQQYMFDLDYNESTMAVHTIDAANYGNLSRLINHNCDPNCFIWPVTTCNQDSSIYKLCYFTRRPIKAGEELTIDYTGDPVCDLDENEIDMESDAGEQGNAISHRQQKRAIQCKCGSVKCRGTMFL